LIDLEISLVKAFGWSLADIDETDIESLLSFVYRLNYKKAESAKPKQVYCDQVSWL